MDYYSFNRPRRDGWLSWPCWLTDSGRFIHKVVTRPAISLVQVRVSSPARTGGLTTMLRHQCTQPKYDIFMSHVQQHLHISCPSCHAKDTVKAIKEQTTRCTDKVPCELRNTWLCTYSHDRGQNIVEMPHKRLVKG